MSELLQIYFISYWEEATMRDPIVTIRTISSDVIIGHPFRWLKERNLSRSGKTALISFQTITEEEARLYV